MVAVLRDSNNKSLVLLFACRRQDVVRVASYCWQLFCIYNGMKLFLSVMVITLAVSCNNTAQLGKAGDESATIDVPAARDSVIVLDSITTVDSTSAILPGEPALEVTVPAESLPLVRLQRTFSSNNQVLHVTITGLTPGQLKVNLSHSMPDANIRISKIIRPDGSTDGPFGQQMVYDITQTGNYTFVINRSNMASGSQVGDVFVSVEK